MPQANVLLTLIEGDLEEKKTKFILHELSSIYTVFTVKDE